MRSVRSLSAAYHKVAASLGWFSSPLWAMVLSLLLAVTVYWVLPLIHGVPREPFFSLLVGTACYIAASVREMYLSTSDWRCYRDILSALSHEPEGDYHYEDIRFIYLIGRRKSADAWIRKYTLVAEAGGAMKLKGLQFGVRGGAPRPLPFARLGIRTSAVDKSRRVLVVPYSSERETSYWEGAVYFHPALKGKERLEFEISGYWEDAWKDLRNSGKDDCRVQLTKHADRCEVAITAPRGMDIDFDKTNACATGVKLESGAKLQRAEKRELAFGRKQLCCVFTDVRPGFYTVFLKKV